MAERSEPDALKMLGQAYDQITSNAAAWQVVMDDLEAKTQSIPDPDHRAGAALLLLHLIRRAHLSRHLKQNGTTPKRAKTTIGVINA